MKNMSIQEKRTVVNIFSAILVTGGYFWYVFRSRPDIGLDTIELLKFWAKTVLVLLPVTIASRIVIHILFGIGNAIVTRETEFGTDERDKMIELKASRVSGVIFGMGFLLSLGALLLDFGVNGMFMVILCGGLLAEIIENLVRLSYYRRGF
jgi:hypothetical protein